MRYKSDVLEIFSISQEKITPAHPTSRRSKMGRSLRLTALITFLLVFLPVQGGAAPGILPTLEDSMEDTIFVDDFNRAGPGLGSLWTADYVYQIVSNELSNTDTIVVFDDLALYNPASTLTGDKMNVSFRWGTGVDTTGMVNGGLALMMDGASTTSNGYFLFRNYNLNRYAIWGIVNGTVTSQIATSATPELDFFEPGDEFQVSVTSDGSGHHFDIFVSDRYDIRLTDPNKLYGNADTLYAGVMLNGGYNNNVDDFTFFKHSSDTTPPSVVGDLTVESATPTSITLTWTAPGDDDSTGTASKYDIRYSRSVISELNFDTATRATAEPVPSAFGSTETFTVTGLEPDTKYYFAMKSEDEWPNRNISDLSNVDSGWTSDNIAPAAISDLSVGTAYSRTALLTWTATGDNDTVGIADMYDIRYSTSPITEANYPVASRAVGEPDPLVAGSAEEYMIGGLNPGTTYYFAVKAVDEFGNPSPLSNSPFVQTTTSPTITDYFDRQQLGSDWIADPEFAINNGELTNVSIEERWDFMAVYTPITNVEAAILRWGINADNTGIGDGGFALMLDEASPDANGYLLFRHRVTDKYALWTIVNGAPDQAIAQSAVSSLPYPQAGDVFEVAVSSDIHGHHFDCYINGVYDTRVSDTGKVQGNAAQLWSGVMLHGNRNNNVDYFFETGPTANVAPGGFSLLSPVNGAVVETGAPLLDWEDSVDPNLSDSVLYTLNYGTSAVFDPDSTTVIEGLAVSQYAIPPMSILALVRGNDNRPVSATSPMATDDVSVGRTASSVPNIMEAAGGNANQAPSSLPDDVVVYWKVKAVDIGSLETWSLQLDWSFTVSIPEPPLPFSLLSPDDGDTVQTRTPTLIWEASSDPDPGDVITYTLIYDTNPGFEYPIIIAGLDETSFAMPSLDENTFYYWKVLAVDSKDLETQSTQTFSFFVPTLTGIGDEGGGQASLPKVFALSQNYPNPFNPSTSIRFDVPEDVSSEDGVGVLLQVYSLRGQLIKTLADGVRTPGSYVVQWDGSKENGEKAGSGIYLYRIQAGSFSATKKMVVLK